MPEIFVDESFDVATTCSLEEAMRFPGIAVQPRLRTQKYLIRFPKLEKRIDVETGGNCYGRVAPFGDQCRFGILFVQPGSIIVPERTDPLMIRIIADQ